MGISLEYEGLQIEVTNETYNPSDDSYLLAEHLDIMPTDVVLEIGTGCGIIALVAARTARKVIATDISPVAVQCARKNIKTNQLESKIEIRQGDLFSPLKTGERFNLILSNPPYLPESEENHQQGAEWLEKAWNGGRSGRKFIDYFIKNCKLYLEPLGRVLMVQSSLSDIPKSCELFQKQGFQVELGETKSFFFEKLVLLKAHLEESV
ncbi:MAG: tRNA (adenine(22)-N(1))-methyltransferase TrmK [Candidatus Helarchaeota archaeon]|nr:tRNA (adenine(22)-N(1))-methyltransferase TrmK [Candidatus Helarchaeota archaeon]